MRSEGREQLRAEAPELRPVRAPEDGRRRLPAGKVLIVMLVALLVWSLLDARSLYRSARAAPVGARRTVALGVTRALLAISRYTLLDRAGTLVERALGRDPNAMPGGSTKPVVIGVPPAPTIRPSPTRSAAPPSPGAVLPPLRRPSVSDPLRILVIGDSFAEDLAFGLARNLGDRYTITADGRQSTGLARVDYFDWPAQAAADVARYRPELVFALFGGNDDQSLLFRDGSAISFHQVREWNRSYAERVQQIISATTADGARLVWVGLPVMGTTPAFNVAVRRLNTIYRRAMDDRPDLVYVDSFGLFATRKGSYTAYVRDQHGDLQIMRTPDRVHLTPAGNEFLAYNVMRAVRVRW